MEMGEAVQTFRNEYDGLPLHIFVTGGGFSLTEIAKRTGASRYLREFVMPYSEDMVRLYAQGAGRDYSFVSKEACAEILGTMVRGLEQELVSKVKVVVVTAALPTNRERRGENAAYVSIWTYGTGPVTYKISFAKEQFDPARADAHRRNYDWTLAQIVLSLILENDKILPPKEAYEVWSDGGKSCSEYFGMGYKIERV